MKRSANSLFVLAISLLLTFYTSKGMADPLESVSGKPFLGLWSVSVEPVSIVAGGMTLTIPRNYLETAAIVLGKRVVIEIETSFPDFRGAEPSTLQKFSKPFLNKDIVRIRRIDPITTSVDVYQKDLKHQAGVIKGDAKEDLVKLPFIGADVWVGVISPIDYSVLIFCSLPYSDPVRCSAKFEAAPGLEFEYEFDKSQLYAWRDLDSGAKKLISTFIAPANAGRAF